jgi:hypothetical protein
MRYFAALMALSLASAGLAQASRVFEEYEGPNAVREGEGGTKIVRDGVEFWTSGAPPRQYQVLGILRDNRPVDYLNPNPVGSKGTAKKIKELGGDGVIVEKQDSAMVSSRVEATSNETGDDAKVTVRRVDDYQLSTRFVVFKYLP